MGLRIEKIGSDQQAFNLKKKRSLSMCERSYWKSTVHCIWAIVFLFTLSGCGGGSSSGGASDPAPISSANGIWYGTFTEPTSGTFKLIGLAYNGEIMAISSDAGVLYYGDYTLSHRDISGSANAFAIDGGLFATVQISGTYSAQGSINASASTLYLGTGERTTSSISLAFDEVYNRPSALSMIRGIWTYSEPGYSSTYAVDSFGQIEGFDTTGCVYNGIVSLLDSAHNLYAVDVDVSQCGAMNGPYAGFATLVDDALANDTLFYSLIGDQYITLHYLLRQ